MPPYKSSGEENLRANASVKSATPNDFPSTKGKDMGGTDNLRANAKVMVGSIKEPNPRQSSIDIPPGLQHFNDDQVK